MCQPMKEEPSELEDPARDATPAHGGSGLIASLENSSQF